MFSGDGEVEGELGEEGGEEDVVEANAEAGPSSAPAEAGAPGEGGDEPEGEAEGDEPEDDYNAAWEVLDVARTIYAKIVDDKPEEQAREDRLNLAECYLALGDVSLETGESDAGLSSRLVHVGQTLTESPENFPQAAQDYTEALAIKSKLLPPSSRALASVHYQLATVLEFTPNGRSTALEHVSAALAGFKARLEEINGKNELSDELKKMGEKERENEKKDVEGLIGDLELKIEELKAAPEAVDPVSESIKHLLGQGGESAFGPSSSGGAASSATDVKDDVPVNNLTSMVKKKKKPAAPASAAEEGKGKGVENGEKRKVEEEEGTEQEAKKPKTE